ncbi:aldehyde-activating protein [Pseudomonas sp. CCM 7891]|uniref:Aldehyde-activating protein n=1 Tax=Pseudomonas karstica TaxID=1055468 RepID=A0A7X2RXR8_9PSED|nr:GFA family protein [Pseudomonas karstica]MTD21200.1 aldehyde-activating protein [Pseudomonas karstica]
MGFTGQCRCGLVRLQLQVDTPAPLYACHCLNCQRWSGSAFALHMLCVAQAVEVSGGMSTYSYEHEGQTSTQYACGSCFTRLFNETTAAPGMRVVRAGVLEGAGQLAPMAHIWVKCKQPWFVLPEGVAQWPESPTPEAFMSALNG